MKYQLNPIFEWVGHVISGFTGGLYGALKNEELNVKELKKIISLKLQDPSVRKLLVANAIKEEKEEIQELLKSIAFCKKEYERIMNDSKSDNLDKEEAELFNDTTEFEEKIERCKDRIQDLKEAYAKGDINYLSTILVNYRFELIRTEKQRIAKLHRLRERILTYGGIATGGIGYHYAKKGLKNLAKKIATKIK